MSFLNYLEWRHAARSFATNKKVSDTDLKKILAAIRMAPTSYGLQPFRVEVISSLELKTKVFEVGYNQKQYSTCSEILVFISRSDVLKRIDDYFELATGGDSSIRLQSKGYENSMRGSFTGKTRDEILAWADRQSYIALGFALAACAELKIDSCPMEGFKGPDLDRLLQVKEGERSCVLLTVGYVEPSAAPRPKIRFSDKDLFTFR